MPDASLLRRKETVFATSLAVTGLLFGDLSFHFFKPSGQDLSKPSRLTKPGATALHLTPKAANSTAANSVYLVKAALLDAYRE